MRAAQLMGYRPLPADDDPAGTRATLERHQAATLASRLQVTVWCALAGMLVSLTMHHHGRTAWSTLALDSVRLLGLVVFVATLVALHQGWIRSWRQHVGLAFVVGLTFLTLPTANALATGDLASMPLLLLVEVMGLASFFPWGIAPQAAFVTASLVQLQGLLAVHPTQTFGVNSVIAVVVAAGASIYMAASFERQRIVAILVDRQRERQLAETRRFAALKTGFATQTSHEFRTPLAVIKAATEAIRHYGPRMTAAQLAQRLDRIDDNVQHMTQLLDDVLAFGHTSTAETCTRRPIDVRAMCEHVVADVQATSSALHRLVLDCTEPLGVRAVDPKLTRQIMRNLVSNAVKYSPHGGEVRVSLTPDDEAIVLAVHDQGIGIDAADQEHLFEVFRRGQNVGTIPGSGLGLAIAHRAATLHGGSIAVESTVGEGTQFVVRLPAPRVDAAAPVAT